MGLKLKKYINASGVEVEEGYFKLLEVSYNDIEKVLHFSGAIWLNKDIMEAGFKSIDIFEDGFNVSKLPSENLFEVVYKYILDTATNNLEEKRLYKGFIGAEYDN